MQAWLNEDRIKNLVGGEAKDHRERKGTDGCVVLHGRSHQGRPVAGNTPTMISHGVEISIAGREADEKDERKYGAFFFSFFLLFFFFFFFFFFSFFFISYMCY